MMSESEPMTSVRTRGYATGGEEEERVTRRDVNTVNASRGAARAGRTSWSEELVWLEWVGTRARCERPPARGKEARTEYV